MKARASDRIRLETFASYRTARGMQWDAQLYDLSQTGCRIIDRSGQIATGDRLRLFIAGTGPHLATATWRRGKHVGLALRRPLPERVFQLLAARDWAAARAALPGGDPGSAPIRFL